MKCSTHLAALSFGRLIRAEKKKLQKTETERAIPTGEHLFPKANMSFEK
jgi:hypothetical protein